ncbi:MAG: DDE-type integrase/transposase/recombinase [Deltaproteobacteria bacterium]|nr:DDE-type integrase/transposase/recombinase [Deltaproteobacteria bacterium]
MPSNQSGAVPIPKIGNRRVNPGEPGRNVMKELKDGYPAYEKPLALAPPPSPSAPAIIPEESKAVLLSPGDEIAHYRYDLISAIEAIVSSQKHMKAGKVISQCLLAYNSGIFLPDIFKRLKHVSRSTFYDWRKSLREGGIENLSRENGRKGESKITDDEKNCLFTILKHQNRIKIGTAIRLMKYIFLQKKIPSPSGERTLRRYIDQFRKEHYDLWVLCREGEKALNDKVLPYIERDRNLLEVGEGLVADGHRLNFDVVNPFTGKPCRPAMVLFLDWRSNYPLGWEILLEESTQCIASALRNAILTLGKIPKWLLIDNGKAFKAKVFNSDINFEEAGVFGMFLRLGINAHFSQLYNAQAKISERLWRTFTDSFERLMESFRGSSIEDKPAYLKRNEKLARSIHNCWIPEIWEVNDLICQWREFYIDQPSRGLAGKTPREIFEPGKGPGVDPAELAYLMMSMEVKNINRNGINLFGCNWYDEALYGLRDQVIIKYSLSDLSQIYCFYKNKFLCTLKPRSKTHPMASESGTPKDMEDVKRQIAQKKSQKKQTVKLLKMFNLSVENQKQFDYRETIKEVQAVIEAKATVHQIISPFADDVPLDIDFRSSPEKAENNTISEGDELKFESTVEEDIQNKDGIVSDQISEDAPTLSVDPRTNLSRPGDGTIFRDDFEYYEWYRGINERFPGILTNEDWKKIEKYEATEEWTDFYGKRGFPHLVKTESSDQFRSEEQ